MDTDGIEKLIGRLYTSFIMRDLTFLVSGGLVLAFITAPVIDTFSRATSQARDYYWLATLAFLAVSYVAGILLQEFALIFLEHIPHWLKMRNSRQSSAPDPLVVRLDKIQKQCSPYTLLGIERILFLKQIGATHAIALLAVGILVWLKKTSVRPVGILVILAFGVLLCIWIFYRMSWEQEEIIKRLESTSKSVGAS